MTKETEFRRIFSPRTEKAVKAISLLTNGVRYSPTQKETDHLLAVLKESVNDIAQVYGVLPPATVGENIKSAVEAAAPEGRVEASRIDAKIASIKRSAFAHADVDMNVRSIPDNQLSAYVTQIMHRMCERFDTTEGS